MIKNSNGGIVKLKTRMAIQELECSGVKNAWIPSSGPGFLINRRNEVLSGASEKSTTFDRAAVIDILQITEKNCKIKLGKKKS